MSFSLDTATAVSDSEAKGHGRRPRRRTTGGSDVGEDVEKAKRLQQGHSSEQDAQGTQTLSRQQIITMVKKRFGLKQEGAGDHKPNGIQEDAPVRATRCIKIEKHKIIFQSQFGFRKGHSTAQAITEITNMLMKAIDNNLYTCGVFLDFSKAFDTVNHTINWKLIE